MTVTVINLFSLRSKLSFNTLSAIKDRILSHMSPIQWTHCLTFSVEGARRTLQEVGLFPSLLPRTCPSFDDLAALFWTRDHLPWPLLHGKWCHKASSLWRPPACLGTDSFCRSPAQYACVPGPHLLCMSMPPLANHLHPAHNHLYPENTKRVFSAFLETAHELQSGKTNNFCYFHQQGLTLSHGRLPSKLLFPWIPSLYHKGAIWFPYMLKPLLCHSLIILYMGLPQSSSLHRFYLLIISRLIQWQERL